MPRKIKDMIGRRYTRLVVLRENGHDKHGMRIFECLCDCGNVVNVPIARLQNGQTKSCGCIRNKYGLKPSKDTKLYRVWSSMRRRCNNSNDSAFHNYGARGIYVCDLWNCDYGSFMNWAYQNGYHDGLSIDRINNDGPYSPDNCRWVDRKVQQNNMRSNRFIEFNGERKTISGWAECLGIKPQTLQQRLQKWSLDRALTERRHEERVRN